MTMESDEEDATISCTEMGWAPEPGIIAVNKHIKTSFS